MPVTSRKGVWGSLIAVLSNRKFWYSALLAIVGAAAGVIAKGGWERCCSEKPIYMPIAVVPLNGANGELVVGADVYLGIPEISSKQTDAFGIAHFENIPSSFRGRPGHVTVRKEGFLPPKPNDYPITIQPRNWKDPFLVSIARIPPPPPPLPPPPVREKITQVYQSGPKPSGPGKSFSQWYMLCSRDPPPGYVIENAFFKLVGDRSCGGWANCGEDSASRSAIQVCWKFQMQGHEEWAGAHFGPFEVSGRSSSVAASEGILTVVWSPR